MSAWFQYQQLAKPVMGISGKAFPGFPIGSGNFGGVPIPIVTSYDPSRIFPIALQQFIAMPFMAGVNPPPPPGGTTHYPPVFTQQVGVQYTTTYIATGSSTVG